MKEEISFAEKARIVADQYDKWNIPLVLLEDKFENSYSMIERLYEALSKYEAKEGESHNQWYARITAERYPHYIKKMGGKKTNTRETKEEREARFQRYEEHKKKFYER